MKVKAKTELWNEDYKTQIALGYPNIPEGTILEVKNTITNFYGKYYEIVYDGHLYYINPRNVEVLE